MDVPYGDSFTTDNLFVIKSSSDGASVNFRVASRVNFTKSTWGFGGIIEKNANQGSRDFAAQWLTLARQKIEREYTKPKVSFIVIRRVPLFDFKAGSFCFPAIISSGSQKNYSPPSTPYSTTRSPSHTPAIPLTPIAHPSTSCTTSSTTPIYFRFFFYYCFYSYHCTYCTASTISSISLFSHLLKGYCGDCIRISFRRILT